MKPKIIFILFLFCLAGHLIQAQTIRDLFARMPQSEFLPLTVSDRLDLIDFYNAGQKAVVKNRLDDSCSIIRMTNDYLQIQTGKNTTELFLLPMVNDSKIIGLIQTVCAPACDSRLEFYTASWKKLTTSMFITFAGKYDFLKDGINREDETVKNALIPLDIFLMQLHYDPDKQMLQQYYTTPDYLNGEDRAKVTPYLTGMPKQFKWNQMRFE